MHSLSRVGAQRPRSQVMRGGTCAVAGWGHGRRRCGRGGVRGVCIGREVQKMHRSGGASLGRSILTGQVAVAAPRARLGLLALDPSLCAGLTGVGDTACAGGRVDAPPFGAVAIIIVVGTVSLEKISTPKSLAANLNHEISDWVGFSSSLAVHGLGRAARAAGCGDVRHR